MVWHFKACAKMQAYHLKVNELNPYQPLRLQPEFFDQVTTYYLAESLEEFSKTDKCPQTRHLPKKVGASNRWWAVREHRETLKDEEESLKYTSPIWQHLTFSLDKFWEFLH